MRKILFLFMMISAACVLASCSVQYNMSGLKKLEFKHPADWKIVEKQDDYTYDYVFRFQNQGADFKIYLRTIYAPLRSPMQWLRQERINSRKKGYNASKISRFSTKAFKWHLMETEDMVSQAKENVPISIRYYIAKEEKSPRMIQCYIAGKKNSFDKLPAAQLNKFLDSISLEPQKVPEKDIALYDNYLSSAAEAVFLRRGEKLLETGKFLRAIAVFNSLLNRPITNKLQVKLHFLLSVCFLEKGIFPYIDSKDGRDFTLAILSAERAIKIQKKYWQAYFNIGIAYLNTGEFARAKTYLKQALNYCPKTDPEYALIVFYYDETKAPLRYKRSISKMFSQQTRITGFVYAEKDPVVIILDKSYRKGDKISGYTILKITRDKAYMRLGLRVDEFISGDLIIQPQTLSALE
ncbi:MAG: tetratricopeptide repeat protein [Candidatus Omnitrophota bacterium]